MTWPLTKQQIEGKPWGLELPELDPDRGKVITDPVHGDVLLMPIEVMIIDSPAFQRLRRVRQLGTTHLVYPGATHSRFSHGIGTLQVAQRLLDVLLSQRESLHYTPDLFHEWAGEDDEGKLNRESARVVVLARLGALLHDLLHVPFGHSIEDELQILDRHDANVQRFDRLWEDLGEDVRGILERDGLDDALRPLIISKTSNDGKSEDLPEDYPYPFVADLVGNTICADLLDYLDRDHRSTGIPFSLGDRFTASFYAVPATHPLYSKKMAMRIGRKDHERTDVVTELLKALRYRYELSERVLFHHAKLAADVMVGKCFGYLYDSFWLEAADAWSEQHSKKFDVAPEVGGAEARDSFFESFGKKASKEVQKDAREKLDELLTSRGDDGLLEYIQDLGAKVSEDASTGAPSSITAGEIATQILHRHLFKTAGRASRTGAPAEELYKKYEKPDARRKLEREAEEYAELGPAPKVAIWLPDPTMKVKPAEVLVDYRGTINTFYSYEEHGARRGSDIYSAHARLWGLWVFVDPDVDDESRRIVLSFLSRRLGVRWDKQDPMLGDDPTMAPDHLAAMLVSEADEANETVKKLIDTVATQVRARGGGGGTFEQLRTVYKNVADAHDEDAPASS